MTCREFKSQLNDPTTTLDGFNCTPTSTAMAMYRATCGAVDVYGGEVRARITNPDGTPDREGGTRLPQNIAAAATWGVELENRTGRLWGDFLADVRGGRGAILQGDYDTLALCSSTFKDNHAVYVDSVTDTTALVGDPLCREFRTVPLSVLRRYAEKLGEAQLPSDPQAIYYAVTPPDREDEMITLIKGEDWKPSGGVRRPVRATPDRAAGKIVGYIEANAVVRTVAEAVADANNWRLTEFGGKPGWLLRSDLTPLVAGGDPVTDQQLTDYIARKASDSASYNAGVQAASAKALEARK